MYSAKTKIRVRYGETDRMGYAYYGVYAQYLEVARVEALRSLGVSYKSMEDNGIMMPVLDYQIKYYKPLFYDDHPVVITSIDSMPDIRIHFKYRIMKDDVLVSEASTTLVFVDINSGKPRRAPADLLAHLQKHF